jgi:hypothetical protein
MARISGCNGRLVIVKEGETYFNDKYAVLQTGDQEFVIDNISAVDISNPLANFGYPQYVQITVTVGAGRKYKSSHDYILNVTREVSGKE